MAEQWRDVLVEWRDGASFTARNPQGASVQLGSSQGRPGVSPMEMILIGLAGCTGVDVVSILTKQKQALQDLRIRVRGKRAEEHPRVYTDIEIEFLLWGDDLDPRAVERAINLSQEKYCSATAMLKQAAEIRTHYRILQPQEKVEIGY